MGTPHVVNHGNFFRPDLIRAGIPPSRWLDFEPTIRRLAKVLKSDKFALYEVEKVESSSGGTVKKPIGMAWLTLPDDLVLAKKGKTKMDDIVARTQKIRQQLESVVWPESGIADGTNFAFLRQLKDEVSRGREEATKKLGIGRSYWAMYVFPMRMMDQIVNISLESELFLIHPEHQRCGAGTTLLSHCIALAEEGGYPVLLESSPQGMKLYPKMGFENIGQVNISHKGSLITLPMMIRIPSK